jgi:hypothetical protein
MIEQVKISALDNEPYLGKGLVGLLDAGATNLGPSGRPCRSAVAKARRRSPSATTHIRRLVLLRRRGGW